MTTRKNIAITATAVTALTTVGVGGMSLAHATTSSNTTTSSTQTHMHHDGLKEHLDSLVKSGKITQAQETTILSGMGGQKPTSHNDGFGPKAHMHQGNVKELATALKLTPKELKEDFKQGKTLSEIANTQKVSQADVISSLEKSSDTKITKQIDAQWNKTHSQNTSTPKSSNIPATN